MVPVSSSFITLESGWEILKLSLDAFWESRRTEGIFCRNWCDYQRQYKSATENAKTQLENGKNQTNQNLIVDHHCLYSKGFDYYIDGWETLSSSLAPHSIVFNREYAYPQLRIAPSIHHWIVQLMVNPSFLKKPRSSCSVPNGGWPPISQHFQG